MTQPRSALALISLIFLAAGCEHLTGPSARPAWKEIPLDQRVTDAYTDFGFELFRQTRSESPDGNVFVSPTSAAFALAMTWNGAAGRTADEMAEVLGVAHLDRATVNATNRTWLDALRQTREPKAELAVANSIWYRSDQRLVPAFRERVSSHYGAEIAEITDAAAINRWVGGATRGRIDKVIETIPGNVTVYLINAVYFKADWTKPFRESDTRPGPFHLPNGSTVSVPMMSQSGAFEIRSDAEMTMLRLPYGTGRFSMLFALPKPGSTLDDIAGSLDGATWRRWMTEFAAVPRLQIEVPKFEVEWESSLVESLQRMGMEAPFLPGQADFSGMFENGELWVDDVFQKTFLRIDEKGSEAAAVTVVVGVDSAPPSLVFDRPFFLAIYDHATSTVLFLGQVTDPS
ncbi:serpin family protein [soil metagenome]